MKKKIIGICIVATFIVGLIVLLICNWAGAFKPLKANAESIPIDVEQKFRQQYSVGIGQYVPIFKSSYYITNTGPTYRQNNPNTNATINSDEKWQIIVSNNNEWTVKFTDSLLSQSIQYEFKEQVNESDMNFYSWYTIGSTAQPISTTIADMQITHINPNLRAVNNIYQCQIYAWSSNSTTLPGNRATITLNLYIRQTTFVTPYDYHITDLGNITLRFTINNISGAMRLFSTMGNITNNINAGATLINNGYDIGFNDGFNQGYNEGYTSGYNNGKNESDNQWQDIKTTSKTIIQGVIEVLDVKLFGFISIGDIITIAVVLSLVFLVFRLIRS